MSRIRSVSVLFICVVLHSSLLCAEPLSTYRGLQLGMSLAAAAKQTDTNLTEVRVVHQRPAVIQEMSWQPRLSIQANPVDTDPVSNTLLCFVKGNLFRIIVTYDRYKIEGMKAEDVIELISQSYGPAKRTKAEIAYHSNYGEVASVLARWENLDYSYDLVRTGDQASFALVLYSKLLDTQAQAFIAESSRLDAQEAPQRELEMHNQHEKEQRLSLEKVRSTNRANFRP